MIYWAVVAVLLGLLGTIQVSTALQETQTYDEGVHLAAGYSYLKTGDYRINVEHPPLGKILAALPLLPLKPHVPLEDPSWNWGDQRDFARAFLYRNHVPADTLLLRARLVTILLTCCLGVALAAWTRRHFGAVAGLLAVLLYALDPNITAHGRYVTSDLPVSLFIFLACTVWGTYLASGKFRHLLWAALVLGLALVGKFSALFLFPVFVALYLIRCWQQRTRVSLRRLAVAGLVLGTVSTAVIGLSYARETKRLTFGGRSHFVPLTARIERETSFGQALYRTAEVFHLPAYSYLVGLESAERHDRKGHFSYVLGQRSETGGWWYYFPVAFAVKTPTAVLLMAGLSLVLALRRLVRPPLIALAGRLRQLRFEWYLLAVPAAAYFALSMRSNINLGLRHILPVYPFLFILVAAIVLRCWPQRLRKALPVLLCAVVALQAVESLRIYPHYLAFFNLASGGPVRGPDYLVDSNIDWGQDLKKLKIWWEARGQPPLCLAYFGQAEPEYYGLRLAGDWIPPTWDQHHRDKVDCIGAISVTVLKDIYRFQGEFEWLREREPIGNVGYSIYLYDLRKRPPVSPS